MYHVTIGASSLHMKQLRSSTLTRSRRGVLGLTVYILEEVLLLVFWTWLSTVEVESQ